MKKSLLLSLTTLVLMLFASFSAAAVQESSTTFKYTSVENIESALQKIEAFSLTIKAANSDAWEILNSEKGTEFRKIAESGDISTKPVAKYLKDKTKTHAMRITMCMILTNIHNALSAQMLKEILDDKSDDIYVRRSAGQGLAEMNWPGTGKLLEKIVEDRTVPLPIRTGIMGGWGGAGYDNVDWLNNVIKGDAVFKDKTEKLSLDEGSGIIWNAIRALGHSKNPKATDILIERAKENPNASITIEALMNRNDKKTIPILIKILQTKESETTTTRTDAAIALGNLEAKEAVKTMIEVLANSKNYLLITRIAESLAKIKDKSAINALKNKFDTYQNQISKEEYAMYLKEEKEGAGPIFALKDALRRLKNE